MLPYLANLTAFRTNDPVRLRELAGALARDAPACPVVSPHPHWVVQVRPLPHGPDFTASLAERGLFFVEGPEHFLAASGELAPAPLLKELRKGDPDFVRFVADLGFLHVDPEGQATMVRSCAGRVPLYFWELNDVFTISSTLQQRIHCFRNQPAELDPLVAAMHAGGVSVYPNGRTTLAGVQILETGHFLRTESGKPAYPRKYWPVPRTTLSPMTPSAWIERAADLRHMLSNNMDAELSPTHNNLITFSGGVDSSCVVSIGSRLGKPLVTYSLLDPEGPKPEPHVERIHRTFKIKDRLEHELSLTWRAAVRLSATPLPVYLGHPVLCFLPELVARWQPATLSGGEYADRLLGGRGQTRWDTARDSSLGSLWRSTPARDFLRWSTARVLGAVGPGGQFRGTPFAKNLAGWVRAEVRAEYQDWLRDQAEECRSDAFPRWHLRQRIRMNAAVGMNWEACSRLNVRRTYPFLTRNILDLALGSHPADHYGSSSRREQPAKKMLRQALQSVVPRKNLFQADKPLPSRALIATRLPAHFWGGQMADSEALAGVICPEVLRHLPFRVLGPVEALRILGLLNIVRSLRT